MFGRIAVLALALLLAAGACDTTGATTPPPPPPAGATSTPTAAPTALPTDTPKPSPPPPKKPFFPALAAVGGNTFVNVTGAPVRTVCSVKAFLKSGREITGPALKPRTVAIVAQGVSWSDQDGQLLNLPNLPPPSGTNAYWLVSCTNNAYDPPTRTATQTFTTP